MNIWGGRLTLALAATAGFYIGGLGGSAAQDKIAPITITMADHVPETSLAVVAGTKVFMARVGELTGGAVTFQYFPNGQLGGAKDAMTLVQSGAVQIAMIAPTSNDAKMPLSGIFALPGLYDSAEAATVDYLDLLANKESSLIKADYDANNLIPLVHTVLDPYQVTSKFEVTGVDSLKGKKIRNGSAGQGVLLSEIGATAVSVSGPETYEALDRGGLDGTLLSVGTIESYSLEEVATHNTVNLPLGSAIIGYSIRRDVFEGLEPGVQEALLTAAREVSLSLAKAFDTQKAEAQARLSNIKWVEYSDAELEQWSTVLGSVQERWVADLQARGLGAQEFMHFIRSR